MDPTVRTIILIVLIVLLVNAIWFTLSRYFLRRAMLTVIKIFREHQALNDESAQTKEELGLESPNPFQLRWFLDFKPTAFRVLLRNGIIRVSKNARGFFLSESLLAQTNLEPRRH